MGKRIIGWTLLVWGILLALSAVFSMVFSVVVLSKFVFVDIIRLVVAAAFILGGIRLKSRKKVMAGVKG